LIGFLNSGNYLEDAAVSEFWDGIFNGILANLGALEIAVGACCVSMVFEKMLPAIPDPGLGPRLHNIFVFVFVLLGLLALPFLASFLAPYIPETGLFKYLLSNWNESGIAYLVAATLIYAAVWDFFQYWVHRAQHYFPILWKFHRVHHSDTSMNASTSLRQSFGSILLGYLLVHIPTVILCGADLLPIIGSYILFSGWGYLNHSNIKIEFGWMASVFSGPQWHRLHHGKSAAYHDCNYAAFFPVYDIFFGTMKSPIKNEWPETGIKDDTTPNNPFLQVFFPWRNAL
jgi:sterol desaturase/sphingolipid hydroxylase (fatty acid hydroxylase superfamily)